MREEKFVIVNIQEVLRKRDTESSTKVPQSPETPKPKCPALPCRQDFPIMHSDNIR